MAVPKQKMGRARTHARRSANDKIAAPSRSVCPQCGANLNEGPCACSAQPDDGLPRMSDGRVSPFAALKDLDLGE